MDKTEYTYVNEHLISSSLICPICLDILQDPHTHIVCDSAFCHSCLLQLTEPVCPICRWGWDDLLPIEYNNYLPKTNRLIRNMLDELMVECNQCHTVRRRGQFEHECQPKENVIVPQIETSDKLSINLSVLLILFCILFIYFYRHIIFEQAVDRQNELISSVGIDIDKYLFDKIYYLIVKIFEHSFIIIILNLLLWFNILFYGDRFTSKSINRVLKKFVEISIIINLITYSIYY